MYSSSSRQGQNARINQDGSHNVYCYGCGEFISRSFLTISRAQCELCHRVENGELLTEDAIRQYKLSKQDKIDVSLLRIPEEEVTKSGKFTLRSLGGELANAVNFLMKKKPDIAKKSRELATQKKRGRLFSSIDLEKMEEKPTSMEDLDKQLRDKDQR